MPVKVKKVAHGYKVCDPQGKCLSKKPLSKTMAQKQELAVRLSTLRKEGRIPPQKGMGNVFGKKKQVMDSSELFKKVKRDEDSADIRSGMYSDYRQKLKELKETGRVKPRPMLGRGTSSYATLRNVKCKF